MAEVLDEKDVETRIVVRKTSPDPDPAEQPQEAVNVVKYFSKAEQKKIAARCCDDYDVDVRSRSKHMRRLEAWQKLYSSVLGPKSRPFQNCANVNLPMLAYVVLQIHARLFDMLLPARGTWFYSVPTGEEDVHRAEITEKFTNHYLQREMPDYSFNTHDLLWQFVINGSAFERIIWDLKEGRVKSEAVPIEDFVVPFAEKDLDPYMRNLSRYTYVQYLSLYDLQEYAARGILENVKGLEAAEPTKRVSSSFKDTVNRAAGQDDLTDHSPEDRPRQVLEQHRKLVLPKKKNGPAGFDGYLHPVAITIDSESEKILRIIVREEDDPKDVARYEKELESHAMALQQGVVVEGTPEPPARREICHFVHYRAFPSNGFYGLGFGDFVGPLNQASNTLVNQIIDAATVRTSPPAVVSRQVRMQRGDILTAPGSVVEVDAPPSVLKDGITWLQPPPLDPSLAAISSELEKMANRVAGAGEILSGEPAGNDETATTSKIRLEQAQKQISILARLLLEYRKYAVRNIWRIFAAYLPDQDVVEVLSEDGSFNTLEYSRRMFAVDADVLPAADPRVTSRVQKVEEAMNLAAYVAQNPVTAQNIQIQVAATMRVLRALDEPEMARMVIEGFQQQQQPPPPKPQYEENAGFLNGQEAAVNPEDDDDAHIADMGDFLLNYQDIMNQSPEATQALERHARAHTAQKVIKEGRANEQQQQAQALLGGVPR